jgi:hypothetical protein
MSAILPIFSCFVSLVAIRSATCQEVNRSNAGFLHNVDPGKWAADYNSIIALITTDAHDPGSQCISRDIWDVAEGIKSDLSDLTSNSGESWGTIVLVVILAASALCCFAGAKLIKPSLFICAFLLGYYVGMCLAFLLQDWLDFDPCTVPLIIAIVAGIAAGIIVISLVDWAVFILGAGIGLVTAVIAKTFIVAFINHNNLQSSTVTTLLEWYWVIAVGVAVLSGILLKRHEDGLFIPCTAGVGAWGLSITLMPILAIWGVTVSGWSSLVTFAICILLGLLVQYKTQSR